MLLGCESRIKGLSRCYTHGLSCISDTAVRANGLVAKDVWRLVCRHNGLVVLRIKA
jgi:hypothetical protein